MRKLIKISTHMFDLTIHWNSALVGLQGAILFGIIMLKLFSSNEGVDQLCLVILIFNALAILFILLSGLQFEVTDDNGENVSSQAPSSKPAQQPVAEVNRQARPQPKKKSSSSKQSVINNKVPTPAGSKGTTPSRLASPPVGTVPTPAPAAESVDLSNKTVEEMSEADWEALFKMDEE